MNNLRKHNLEVVKPNQCDWFYAPIMYSGVFVK